MIAMTTASEEEYVTKRIQALQEVVTEPVIGALALNRRGHYTEKFLGRFGFLVWLAARANAKRQAGGLPQAFMAAITPTDVRAFKYKAHGRMRDRFEIGEEVAVWARDSLHVSWQPGPPYQIDVIIESPTETEKVLCRCGKGASSEQALRMMADPSLVA
jgi:hypothetical protein